MLAGRPGPAYARRMSTRLRRHEVAPELSGEIERILKERLGRFGLERVEVRGGLDHAGEPAIFVDAWYRLVDEPIDPEALAEAHLALQDLLVEWGEERFPYVRDHFDAKQRVRGFE